MTEKLSRFRETCLYGIPGIFLYDRKVYYLLYKNARYAVDTHSREITKEILLSHAFEIAREKGISAVTSRSVAKSAGCSIQPVFSHFKTMEDLRRSTFEYTAGKLMQEILENQDKPDFITQTIIWMLNLARNEPNFFKLLYLSDSFDSVNLWDVMMEWECSRRMLSAL